MAAVRTGVRTMADRPNPVSSAPALARVQARRHEIEEAHVDRPGARPSSGRSSIGLVAVVVVVLVASGGPQRLGHLRKLLPAGPGDEPGPGDPGPLHIVFVIAAVIFFVVEGLIVWTVIRYRRKPGDDELPPQTHGNNLAEIVWTVVPTLIVIFLFFISWQTLNTRRGEVEPQPDLKVRATPASSSGRSTTCRAGREGDTTTRCSR